MRRSIIAVIGSLAALTTPALAGPGGLSPESQVTRIQYDRAELGSEAGVARLHTRITEAASTMCADLNELASERAWCEEDAVTRAVRQAHEPTLSLYHRMQTASSGEQTVSLSQR